MQDVGMLTKLAPACPVLWYLERPVSPVQGCYIRTWTQYLRWSLIHSHICQKSWTSWLQNNPDLPCVTLFVRTRDSHQPSWLIYIEFELLNVAALLDFPNASVNIITRFHYSSQLVGPLSSSANWAPCWRQLIATANYSEQWLAVLLLAVVSERPSDSGRVLQMTPVTSAGV